MKKFWAALKKFLFGRTEVTVCKRPASLKCPGCDGWTDQFTDLEKMTSSYKDVAGSVNTQFSCGRCCAVSEWYTGAPVLIFRRVVCPVPFHVVDRLRARAESLQAEHNLILLSMRTPVEPIWDAYTNYTYPELRSIIQQLETRVVHLRKTITGNSHVDSNA